MQFFAEVVQIFGVPKSVGQIYGVLYASPAPLSFSDIFERLEISKGSASQGLQLLRSLGAINEAKSQPILDGGRLVMYGTQKKDASPLAGEGARSVRITYEPELSLRRLVSGVLQERLAPLAVASAQRLARLRALANERDGDISAFYLDQAKRLNTWRRRLKTVLPVLTALLGSKGRK